MVCFLNRTFGVVFSVKKESLLSFLFLFIALMIYIIWRSEDVLVNHLVTLIFSPQDFKVWRTAFAARMPLNDLMIYSLPGALWVFVSTVAFKDFYLIIKKYTFNLMFLPFFIALLLELTQLIHLTHGTFDGWDITLALLFWVASIVICPATEIKEDFLKTEQSSKRVRAIISILILYLAHQI